MIHKVFALSKDKVENQRSFLSLFDELPRRRLEIRFGKFSHAGFLRREFRRLRYSPSVHQLDHRQQRRLGLRRRHSRLHQSEPPPTTKIATGASVSPKPSCRQIANGIDLVWKPWQVHAENFEYELRHGLIPKKSGVVRLLAYTNYANMGIYRDADRAVRGSHSPTPERPGHHEPPWHITRKYGFGMNLEQNLTPQPHRLRPLRLG